MFIIKIFYSSASVPKSGPLMAFQYFPVYSFPSTTITISPLTVFNLK